MTNEFKSRKTRLAKKLDDLSSLCENENYHGQADFINRLATALRTGKFDGLTYTADGAQRPYLVGDEVIDFVVREGIVY